MAVETTQDESNFIDIQNTKEWSQKQIGGQIDTGILIVCTVDPLPFIDPSPFHHRTNDICRSNQNEVSSS